MRKCLVVFLILILLFLTSCWDKVEIEERGYIMGVAIDKYPPIPKGAGNISKEEAAPEEEEKFELTHLHSSLPAYAMTVQLPVVKKSMNLPQGQGGGGGGEAKRHWNLTQVGNSFMEMNSELASRMDLIPYYGHLQAIVISEEAAREGLENVIDFFDRDPEMRKRTKFFVCEKDAKRILDTVPRIEDYASIYIEKIPINADINAGIVRKTDLGETISSIHEGLDFVLPKADAIKDEIKVDGAAVFKGSKMVGWIGHLEMESIKFVRNLYQGGIITADDPESEKGIIVLRVMKSKSKITPVIKGGEVNFEIDISAEGLFAEKVETGKHKSIDSQFLKQAENAFAKQIEEQCRNSIKNIQEKYGADVFRFCEVLRIKKPDYWDKAKEQWHEIFPKVKTSVTAKVTIRQIGNTR